MKLPDAYAVGRYLNTSWSVAVTSVLCGMVMVCIVWASYFSPGNSLYRTNAAAAKEFVRVVEADWPNNRANVYFALHHMRSTYIDTGENSTTQFDKLDRLQDWFLRSQTAGEELLFLTEVRNHGQVTSQAPWHSNETVVLILIMMTSVIGMIVHLLLLSWLLKTDPRLRMFCS